MIQTAVLLTVYNRREITLQGLRSLYKSIAFLGDGYSFDIYMVDDGCTDGTAETVAKEFPYIHIIKGDGNLYWCGGMRMAWQVAIDSGIKYDYYLWFNDDTILYDYAIKELIEESQKHADKCNVVGPVQSDDHKTISYGGYVNGSIVTPNGQEVSVDCFNGNIVLIPSFVHSKLGNLDHHFTHGHGDTDYGYRAKEMDLYNYCVGRFLGECNRHESLKKCWDPKVGMILRFKNLYHPTGYPPKEAFYFERKHYGFHIAVFHLVTLYLRVLFPIIWNRMGKAKL